MKTIILKTFLITVLAGGTLGTAFAQESTTQGSDRPQTRAECLAVGGKWGVDPRAEFGAPRCIGYQNQPTPSGD